MKYEIKGDTLPVVICHLEAGERMITERGSMAWMRPQTGSGAEHKAWSPNRTTRR